MNMFTGRENSMETGKETIRAEFVFKGDPMEVLALVWDVIKSPLCAVYTINSAEGKPIAQEFKAKDRVEYVNGYTDLMGRTGVVLFKQGNDTYGVQLDGEKDTFIVSAHQIRKVE